MWGERKPPGVDASAPCVARVHDALLGGMDNFAADRSVARRLREAVPEVVHLLWCSRAFLGRAVDYLVREAGVHQLIDLGSGLPTIENTHVVAQFADPSARVVYVDADPGVEPHARSILRGNPLATAITADARDVTAVLGHPELRRLIDFSRPVGLIVIGLLHLLPDGDDPHGLVGRYMDALPSGSHLAAANLFASPDPKAKALEALLQATMGTCHFRSRRAIVRLFRGLDLVEPGVVHFHDWHPDDRHPGPPTTWEELLLGGVARKP
jgi:hypothetical protein